MVERDDMQAMTKLVQEIVASRKIEAIHADQLPMAQFALGFSGISGAKRMKPQLIFDAHNAVWAIVERMKRQMPALFGPVIDLESRRIKAYEGQIVRAFDRTLAVSEADRALLIQASASRANGNGAVDTGGTISNRISVVPIGIDTEQLAPISRPTDSKNILTLGTLHCPPNADGVRWFARKIFPMIRNQVPGSTLTIVGKNPPADIQRLAREAAIAVEGYVPDLAPYLEAAAVMVVPVRAGGGMRVRILEGFARGLPMVTTTLGLEGIEAEPGHEILVADTPAEFADAASRLLGDEELRNELSKNGRKLVVETYDWRTALEPLDEIYSDTPIKAYAV